MTTTFPAGTYYVGDLCYVFTEVNGLDWHALLNATGYLGSMDEIGHVPRAKQRTVFTFEGVTFFYSSTMHGDGTYRDRWGNAYDVDSGGIGCIEVSALGSQFNANVGHVVTFTEPFECHGLDANGVIQIGHLRIYTDVEPGGDE